MLEIIPEEAIASAHQYLNGESSFQALLLYGNEFKLAGLSPIYILDNKTKAVFVTSEERINKVFH